MKKSTKKTAVGLATNRNVEDRGEGCEAAVDAQTATRHEHHDQHDSGDGDVDQARLLLQGFDSDTEDHQQDKGFNSSNPIPPLPDHKETQKKLRHAAAVAATAADDQQNPAQKNNITSVVYVGRIPHGFYEDEMRQYFSQFGTIKRLRLSRNRKTGQSKHFAFIEFESSDVATIVAEAMDNYLMYGHILKCKLVRPGALHPDTFKGANRRFKVVPHSSIERRKLEKPRTESQWALKNRREQVRRRRKVRQLEKIGIGYQIELPTLKGPAEVLDRRNPPRSDHEEPTTTTV